MKYTLIIFVVILFILNINLHSKHGIKYMNILELLEYNIKLYLIQNAGLIYLQKDGSKLLQTLTNDPILIKTHRKLHNKHGSVILMPIITKSIHYYILDPNLAKNILKDSPKLFSAGNMKKEFFESFMPKNLGISKCSTSSECPWKKRREFNEKTLGTKSPTFFFDCIQDIIQKNITKPLLNIDDFKLISFQIISSSIYGNNLNTNEGANMLKDFIHNINKTNNLLETSFYEKYIQHLSSSYTNAPKCSLLHYADLYRNDTADVINDQIPHWFAPFIFIISFLIPNMLCIILNFKDIYIKIKAEINKPDFDIYSKRTYLHYCVIEHIRLFNTINISMQRTVEHNITYHELELKKGDQLFILFSSILRDEKVFSQPDEFMPDRWYNNTIDEQNIVFGVGPQQCPSKQISPIYYKTILYHLLKKYDYKCISPVLRNKNENLYFINPYEIRFSITTDS